MTHLEKAEVYSVFDEDYIVPGAAVFETPVTYPSEFFSPIPVKPEIKIQYKDVSLADLTKRVAEMDKSRTLSSELVSAFLYNFFKSVRGTLKKKWSLFGVVFGEEKAEVGIENLATFIEEAGAHPDDKEATGVIPEPEVYARYVCFVYRMVKSGGTDTYKSTLATRLTKQVGRTGHNLSLWD